MFRLRYYIGKRDKDGQVVPAVRFDVVEDILQAAFGGFTVYSADGVWEGKGEPTRVYEVLTTRSGAGIPHKDVAYKCAEICNQSTVLFTTEKVEAYLCTP